jgi:hypothetical protein
MEFEKEKASLPRGKEVRPHGGDDFLLLDFVLSNLFAYLHYLQNT